MHPAFSILFFTTLSGVAQGLVVALALAVLTGVSLSPAFLLQTLALAEILLLGGLGASFLHLGHKMRAWRAVLMWRTSWMSREVIALPAFIGIVAMWWLTLMAGATGPQVRTIALVLLVGAFILWYCTAMIYACLRFIEEWAHSLTIINFTLIGLSSGSILACAMAAMAEETQMLRVFGPGALIVTLVAWMTRVMTLRRNATLRHKSTLHSATGIQSTSLVQKSMGMSAGSFNTREFFHGASEFAVKNVKLGFQLFAFALPALCLVWGMASQTILPWIIAVVCQAPGLLAERWLFFAQAKHPQNLYYQTVS